MLQNLPHLDRLQETHPRTHRREALRVSEVWKTLQPVVTPVQAFQDDMSALAEQQHVQRIAVGSK